MAKYQCINIQNFQKNAYRYFILCDKIENDQQTIGKIHMIKSKARYADIA